VGPTSYQYQFLKLSGIFNKYKHIKNFDVSWKRCIFDSQEKK